jgi:uncharacterized protein YkwD
VIVHRFAAVPVVAASEVLGLVQSSAVAPRVRTVTRSFRRAVVAACVISLAVSGLITWARGARADSSSSLVSMANSARASAGLPALAVSSDLASAARAQASRMAASQTLAHTPNLPAVVCCWSSLGENVGEGPTTAALQAAFMASPAHRANILSSSYTQVGIGVVVDAKGIMWVSEIFRRPSGAVSNPAPAPAPRPAPKPAPKPQPVVTHARQAPAAPTHHAAAQAAPVAPAQPPVAANTRASRDLSRLPLLAAQRLAAELAATSGVTGPDPVSRVLDFVAVNAGLTG